MLGLNEILKNKKGQTLFELILFIPFMLMIYFLLVTISAAINGSINQQKIVRGYLFARIKHNSFAPTPWRLGEMARGGSNTIGMVSLAWSTRLDTSKQGVAPCYKLSTLLKLKDGLFANSSSAPPDDDCEAPSPQHFHQYIRVMTAFGVCGATYSLPDPNTMFLSEYPAKISGCLVQ